MAWSSSGKSGVRMAAGFAYAAWATGILADCFLIAFFALQASNPEGGTSLGSANDLVGSLGTALMVPVALALSAWLPDRRLGRIAQVLGLSAMAVLTVGGPLLVLGVLAFEVRAPIAVAAWMVLSLWLLLINRWLRLSGILLPRLARFGEFLGAGTLAGGAAVGLGLSLPWKSAQPQLALFSVGGVFTAIGMLGTPLLVPAPGPTPQEVMTILAKSFALPFRPLLGIAELVLFMLVWRSLGQQGATPLHQ